MIYKTFDLLFIIRRHAFTNSKVFLILFYKTNLEANDRHMLKEVIQHPSKALKITLFLYKNETQSLKIQILQIV